MGAHRHLLARSAVASLVCGAALVAGAPEDAAAEPVAGFEVAELVTDFETAPLGKEWEE
jgi:hypothetical protein